MGKRQRRDQREFGLRKQPAEATIDRRDAALKARVVVEAIRGGTHEEAVQAVEAVIEQRRRLPLWPKKTEPALTIKTIREREQERRTHFPPTPQTNAAYKILKGQHRRTYGRKGRLAGLGGNRPPLGTNPAVLLKRQRAAEA